MSIRTLPCRIKVKICYEKMNFFIGQNPTRILLSDKIRVRSCMNYEAIAPKS